MVRQHTYPTILRASSLTIITKGIETSALAMLPYINNDLFDLCLSILSVELPMASTATEELPQDTDGPPPVDLDDIMAQEIERLKPDSVRKSRKPEETPAPLSGNAQLQPSLRRAALRCLTTIADANEEHHLIDAAIRNKMVTIVSYVERVDIDAVVKIQAGETLQALQHEDLTHRTSRKLR